MNAIKAAAAVKNKQIYDEVRYSDLIASEFKVHRHCCKDLTNGFTSGVASFKKYSTLQNSPHPPIYEKGDFDKVKNSSAAILLKRDNVFLNENFA